MSALSARWTLIFPIILASAATLLVAPPFPSRASEEAMSAGTGEKPSVVFLPEPRKRGETSLEQTIASRRTRREFSPPALSLADLAQLLWAAQGITGSDGFLRAVPSAGALYPLDLYAVVGQAGAEGLAAGVYHYLPQRHGLQRIAEGDLRQPLAAASLHQTWMTHAPVSLVITAEYERIEKKYGARGQRYALMEVGHACQNIFLQAEALGLAAGIVGAFDDNQVSSVLRLPPTHRPLIVMPVGHR